MNINGIDSVMIIFGCAIRQEEGIGVVSNAPFEPLPVLLPKPLIKHISQSRQIKSCVERVYPFLYINAYAMRVVGQILVKYIVDAVESIHRWNARHEFRCQAFAIQ